MLSGYFHTGYKTLIEISVVKKWRVFCEAGTEYLNIIYMNLKLQSSVIHGYTVVMLNAETKFFVRHNIYCCCHNDGKHETKHHYQPIFCPLHMHNNYNVLLISRPHFQ